MAKLDHRVSLSGWYEADTFTAQAHGDALVGWQDLSGSANHLTATPSSFPTFARDIVNGRPAIQFNGSQAITGPNIATFMSGQNLTMFVVVMATAITANSATGNLNDGIITGGQVQSPGLFLRNNAGTYSVMAFVNDAGGAQTYTSVINPGLNRWMVLVWRRSGATANMYVDQGYDSAQVVGTNPINGTATPLQLGQNYNETTGLTGYIAAALLYAAAVGNDDMQHVINYLANKYLSGDAAGSQNTEIPRGDPLEQARDVGTRRLWAFGRPRLAFRARAPLRMLDVELGTIVTASHKDWPKPDGGGAADTDWRRAYLRLDETDLDMDGMTVGILGRDIRHSVVSAESFIGTLRTDYLRNGVTAIGRGIHTFRRQSTAWVEDAGDQRVIALTEEQEKVTSFGLLLEEEITNPVTRSSFINGTTGLTISAGSGTVAVDTTSPLLFDTSVTPQGLRLTAGNPHVTETRVNHAAFSVDASAYFRISVDHCDRDGTALNWRLQRASDSNWWNDATPAWQVAQVDNAWPVSASTSTITRGISEVIQKDGSTGNVTLYHVLPAGGTASRRNTIYHVQSEASGQPVASSRIVTTTAAVTRAADNFVIQNITWPEDRGTVLVKIRPLFDADAIAVASTFFLNGGFYPSAAAAAYALDYKSASARWNFTFRNSGGTTYEAYYVATPTRLTEYRIAYRWTSSAGELGLTPRTNSIFLNGVKGTDVVAAGSPANSGSITPFFASGFAYHACWELRPYPLSDEEIEAWGV